jgi:hypothetical protein
VRHKKSLREENKEYSPSLIKIKTAECEAFCRDFPFRENAARRSVFISGKAH